MDASSILSTLLSSSSIKGISKAAGTSTANVTSVLSAAVPSLLQGASKQASGSTAASFAQALTDHAQADTSNLTSFFKNADLTDGSKIVSHLLGAKANSTTTSISKAAGTDSATTKSVLSAAAPLLMSLLGQQSSGSSGNAVKVSNQEISLPAAISLRFST